jgi:hypothetical protein
VSASQWLSLVSLMGHPVFDYTVMPAFVQHLGIAGACVTAGSSEC